MEEIIIVDEHDEPIDTKPRQQVEQPDIYRVAALWVRNTAGDVLLAQRKLTKKHDPGKWGPAVAGTVEQGETYRANIIKEAAEEIGLTDIDPIPVAKWYVTGEHNFFCQGFSVQVDKPAADFALEQDAIEQVRWFSTEELEQHLTEKPEDFTQGFRDAYQAFKR